LAFFFLLLPSGPSHPHFPSPNASSQSLFQSLFSCSPRREYDCLFHGSSLFLSPTFSLVPGQPFRRWDLLLAPSPSCSTLMATTCRFNRSLTPFDQFFSWLPPSSLTTGTLDWLTSCFTEYNGSPVAPMAHFVRSNCYFFSTGVSLLIRAISRVLSLKRASLSHPSFPTNVPFPPLFGPPRPRRGNVVRTSPSVPPPSFLGSPSPPPFL